MTKKYTKITIQLDPAPARLSKKVMVNMSQRDYHQFKVMADERGERGVSSLVRRLALAAMESLEGR